MSNYPALEWEQWKFRLEGVNTVETKEFITTDKIIARAYRHMAETNFLKGKLRIEHQRMVTIHEGKSEKTIIYETMWLKDYY